MNLLCCNSVTMTYSREHKLTVSGFISASKSTAATYLMVYVQECVSCCLQTYYGHILLVPTKDLTAYIFVFFKEHTTELVGWRKYSACTFSKFLSILVPESKVFSEMQ